MLERLTHTRRRELGNSIARLAIIAKRLKRDLFARTSLRAHAQHLKRPSMNGQTRYQTLTVARYGVFALVSAVY